MIGQEKTQIDNQKEMSVVVNDLDYSNADGEQPF